MFLSQGFKVTAKELAKLVEDRGDGSVEVIKTKYAGIEGLAKVMGVDLKNGLTGSDTQARKEHFGPNKLEMKASKSFLALCLDALQDPTLMILIVCATISLGTGIYETIHGGPGHETDWVEGVAIIFTIVVVVMVAAGTDYAKEKQFQALNEIANDIKIDVQRQGSTTAISIFDLVVGDVLWVKIGDLLPADGILLESQEVQTDESALTGEPILINKNITDKPFLLSGTKVTSLFFTHFYFPSVTFIL